MIAIVSAGARERSALAALCEAHGWPARECASSRAFIRLSHRIQPRVVIVRHELGDGFSDDVLAALAAARQSNATRIIVLMPAGSPSSAEARQIALGADNVQRDPVRMDVLVEYIGRYYARAAAAPHRTTVTLAFAGATLQPDDRTLRCGRRTTVLTPREVELAEFLQQYAGTVVSYETLYGEILGRRFRGDTGNMRVLLGKLAASTATVGVDLRRWVEVIPKSGYRYRDSASRTP